MSTPAGIGNFSRLDPTACLLIHARPRYGRTLVLLLQSLYVAHPQTLYTFLLPFESDAAAAASDGAVDAAQRWERELLLIRDYARLHAEPSAIHLLRLPRNTPLRSMYVLRDRNGRTAMLAASGAAVAAGTTDATAAVRASRPSGHAMDFGRMLLLRLTPADLASARDFVDPYRDAAAIGVAGTAINRTGLLCDYVLFTDGSGFYHRSFVPATMPYMHQRYDLIGAHFVSPRHWPVGVVQAAGTGPDVQIRSTFKDGLIDPGCVLFRADTLRAHGSELRIPANMTLDSPAWTRLKAVSGGGAFAELVWRRLDRAQHRSVVIERALFLRH